jgi:tryptophan synthase alpha subunit
VVIGSALVETIEHANGSSAKAKAARDFMVKIKRAMKKSRSNGRR